MSSAIQGFPASDVMDVRSLGGVYGRCRLVSVGGIVPAGGIATCFLDQFGQAQTGNIALTNADASFFGGRATNGTYISMFGMQVMAWEADNTAGVVPQLTPATISYDALASVSLRLNLKGQTYPLGNAMSFPSGLGGSQGNRNGGPVTQAFRLPGGQPITLSSNDQWFLEFRAERAFSTTAVGNDVVFSVYCPATTSVSLANLSGA